MTGRTLPAATQRRIGTALFIGMEVAWIAVLFNLIQAIAGLAAEPAFGWATVLYPVTYLFLRLEAGLRLHPAAIAVLRTVFGLAAVFLTVVLLAWPDFPDTVAAPRAYDWIGFITRGPSYPALALVGSVFVILRGALLGPRHLDSRGFLAGFQMGIAVLFAIVFGQHLAGLPETGVVPGMIAFFALGLYGLGANRWLRSDAPGRSANRAGWPLLGFAIITLILATGALFWAEFDAGIVQLLLVPVFWLWDVIGRLFLFLLGLLPDFQPGPMPDMPQPTALPGGGKAPPPFDWGDTVRETARVIFVTTLGFLLGWALLRNLIDLLRWMSRRLGRSEGIAYEQSSHSLFGDLRELLAVLAALLRKLRHRLALLLPDGRTGSPPPEVRAVRETYRRLLIWADKRGWPKTPGQTPYEYLDFLRRSIPQAEPDLVFLTESYVAVRYGAARPEPDTLRQLRASWRQIRKTRKTKKRTSNR